MHQYIIFREGSLLIPRRWIENVHYIFTHRVPILPHIGKIKSYPIHNSSVPNIQISYILFISNNKVYIPPGSSIPSYGIYNDHPLFTIWGNLASEVILQNKSNKTKKIKSNHLLVWKRLVIILFHSATIVFLNLKI